MTKIHQVRMSHSGSDTNSLKGRGDRVSVHTHTDTYNAIESSTNQPTNTPDQFPWKKPLAKPSSRTGQTSSNIPKTLLASSKRPILLTNSVEKQCSWFQFFSLYFLSHSIS